MKLFFCCRASCKLRLNKEAAKQGSALIPLQRNYFMPLHNIGPVCKLQHREVTQTIAIRSTHWRGARLRHEADNLFMPIAIITQQPAGMHVHPGCNNELGM